MSQARTLWEEGREPGYQIVALGLAVALTVATLDLARADRVTSLFDVVFVVVCARVSSAWFGTYTLRPSGVAATPEGAPPAMTVGGPLGRTVPSAPTSYRAPLKA